MTAAGAAEVARVESWRDEAEELLDAAELADLARRRLQASAARYPAQPDRHAELSAFLDIVRADCSQAALRLQAGHRAEPAGPRLAARLQLAGVRPCR